MEQSVIENHPKIFIRNIPDFFDTNLRHDYKKILENHKKPYIVWCGTNHCPIKDFKLSEKSIRKINKEGLDVFIHEPLAFRNKNSEKDFGFGYYSEFMSDVLYSEIIADELDSFENFAKINSLTNVKVITRSKYCEKIQSNYNLIRIIYYNFLENIEHDFLESPKPSEKPIQKKFHCPNNRYNPTRHLIAAYLAGRSSYISWPFNVNLKKSFAVPWIEPERFSSKHLKRIKKGGKLLNNNNYQIDRPNRINQEKNLKIRHCYDVKLYKRGHSFDDNMKCEEFYESFSDAFCCVVNETRFAQPFPMISEKTAYPMLFGLPYIMVGPPYTMKSINWDHSHKTFYEYWDESYDQETNHTERLKKIFDVIDYIDSFTHEKLEDIKNDMKPTLRYNQTINQWKFPKVLDDIKRL